LLLPLLQLHLCRESTGSSYCILYLNASAVTFMLKGNNMLVNPHFKVTLVMQPLTIKVTLFQFQITSVIA